MLRSKDKSYTTKAQSAQGFTKKNIRQLGVLLVNLVSAKGISFGATWWFALFVY